MKPVRIIVFAKAPLPGFAKTRLIPALGRAATADLALFLLQRTLAAALAAKTGPVELCATPALNDAAWRRVALPPDIDFSDQGGGDLGQRMARAAERAIMNGEAALLIGTDCAEMSGELLREAVALLADADAVLHPTADGGYAVLGLNRHDPRLFADIAWSTGSVAGTTVGRLMQLGWRTHIGRTLHDIDEPGDLNWLADRNAADA